MQRIRPDSLFAQMQFLQEIFCLTFFLRSPFLTCWQINSHDSTFFMQSTPITQVCSRDGEVNLRHSRTVIFSRAAWYAFRFAWYIANPSRRSIRNDEQQFISWKFHPSWFSLSRPLCLWWDGYHSDWDWTEVALSSYVSSPAAFAMCRLKTAFLARLFPRSWRASSVAVKCYPNRKIHVFLMLLFDCQVSWRAYFPLHLYTESSGHLDNHFFRKNLTRP